MFPIDQSTLSYLYGNRDMFLCYFSLGLLLQIPVTVMRYFLVDQIGFGAAELAQVAALISFPWAVKPFTAFLSENFVSRIVKRNTQVAVAYGLSGLCWFSFLFFRHDRTGRFPALASAFFSSIFTSYADVTLDASMVRRVHSSTDHGNGRLQSFVLASRAFGALMGSFLSGAFALFFAPFPCIALFHLVGVYAGLKLKTLTVHGNANGARQGIHKSTCSKCKDILKALLYQERIVFVLILFIIASPVSDFAIMQYYFQKEKSVSPIVFSVGDAVASIVTICASLFFNAYLRGKTWQSVVMLPQCVLFVLIAINMLLITCTIDIKGEIYLIVRSVLGSFFGHIGFMPLVVRAADLVPEGFEGTFYSLYMSTVNLGSVVAEELSGLLTKALVLQTTTSKALFYLFVVLHNIATFVCFHLAYGHGIH